VIKGLLGVIASLLLTVPVFALQAQSGQTGSCLSMSCRRASSCRACAPSRAAYAFVWVAFCFTSGCCGGA
jgi:hypothetical protein